MTVRVKICGVTRAEDAHVAARLGADALGFNLWPGSRRHVSADAVRAIVDALPPFVVPVGVFVNQPAAEVAALASRAGVAMVQLHGDESPRDFAGFPLPVLKAVRVSAAASLDALAAWPARGFVLDAPSEGFGGSGTTFDWALARAAAGRYPVLLAGGLTAENVQEAIRTVQPWGVDVASGVESAPGVKDPDRMARFVARAKEVA